MSNPTPAPDDRLAGRAATVRRADENGHPALFVSGEIDMATSPELRDALYHIVDESPSEVIVDLSAMDFIDSSGLGVFVGALKRVREKGGDLRLRGLNPSTTKVFEITGLTRLFTITD